MSAALACGSKPLGLQRKEFWLGGLDSNQDSQIQSLESYQLDDLPADGRNVAGRALQGKPSGYHRNLSRVKGPSTRRQPADTARLNKRSDSADRNGCRGVQPVIPCPTRICPTVEQACRFANETRRLYRFERAYG